MPGLNLHVTVLLIIKGEDWSMPWDGVVAPLARPERSQGISLYTKCYCVVVM
jgi:hypothetical protein